MYLIMLQLNPLLTGHSVVATHVCVLPKEGVGCSSVCVESELPGCFGR